MERMRLDSDRVLARLLHAQPPLPDVIDVKPDAGQCHPSGAETSLAQSVTYMVHGAAHGCGNISHGHVVAGL